MSGKRITLGICSVRAAAAGGRSGVRIVAADRERQLGSGLDGELCFCAGAAAVLGIQVARELELLVGGQLKHLLEALTDGEQDLSRLLGAAALAAGDVAVPAVGNRLAYRASPHTDAVEGLADVDDHAHDLAVLFLLERLADGREHRVQPELVDADAPLVLERVRPLATVLV